MQINETISHHVCFMFNNNDDHDDDNSACHLTENHSDHWWFVNRSDFELISLMHTTIHWIKAFQNTCRTQTKLIGRYYFRDCHFLHCEPRVNNNSVLVLVKLLYAHGLMCYNQLSILISYISTPHQWYNWFRGALTKTATH